MTKIIDFIRDKISDKAMVITGFCLLGVYYFVGLLSYITFPIKPIFKLLVSSSIVSIIIRAILAALICAFSIIVIIKYKTKVKWNWLIIMCFALIMTLISILISPRTYEYMYASSLYHEVHAVRLDPGIPRTIVMYLSSVADFAFAFCILFVMPVVINNKQKLLFILIPIVVIGILECIYSAISERQAYIYLFTHPDDPLGGYGNGVGATFGNKEDWGAFLTVAIVSALASIFFIRKSKKSVLIKICLWISVAIMTIFVVLSLCKTAMLAVLLCGVCLIIGLVVYSAEKNKKMFIIVSALVGFLAIILVAFFATKGFGVSFLNKVYNFLNNFIISKSERAVEGRSALWLNYLENVRGYNLFFGLGKSYVSIYTRMLTPETQHNIHNGFAYFFASYGLVGFFILISMLVVVVKNILNLWRINHYYVFLFGGILLAGISFVLAESEVIIISTSTPIFIFNVLTVILPAGLLYENSKRSVGECYA